MAEYKTFQKKRRNSPKKTIRPFCTIVTHSVLLCYTAIGHFRWDPKWPWAAWQWVVMTFQAFRGLNSVHDLISQQCQQFIALCYLHLWWYFMLFFSKVFDIWIKSLRFSCVVPTSTTHRASLWSAININKLISPPSLSSLKNMIL